MNRMASSSSAVEHDSDWRIGADGLFVGAAQEEAFIRAEWESLGPRVRQIGLYGALAFLTATFTDLAVLGATWVYWGLLLARFGILGWGLTLARLGKAKRVDNVRRVAALLLGFELRACERFNFRDEFNASRHPCAADGRDESIRAAVRLLGRAWR